MGVQGLWKLIGPAGNPVPLDTLENKVLAVDVSIWLHQAIKGFQDAKGASVPNAHLLTIYHRICKLLYYKIKPVFVFDGGVPTLKVQTMVKRQKLKAKNLSEANNLQQQLLKSLMKHSAVAKVLSEKAKVHLPKTSASKQNTDETDIYNLPPSQLDSTISEEDEDDYEESASSSSISPGKYVDVHSIDTKSAEFKALPANIRHEILCELKETRKQSSWGRLHELPTHSDEFSGFQMKRLLKRYSVQASIEEAEKEMGGHSLSLADLKLLLNEHGVLTDEKTGSRIASDENKRYLYIKDLKQTLALLEENEEREKSEASTSKESDEATCQSQLKESPLKDSELNSFKLKITELKTSNLKALEQKVSQLVRQNETSEETSDEANKVNETSEDVKKSNENMNKSTSSKVENSSDAKTGDEAAIHENINYDDEFESDLQRAIELSLQDEPSTSKSVKSKSELSFHIEDYIDSDEYDSSGSELIEVPKKITKLSPAESYMLEYSGLTPNGISELINKDKSSEVKKINFKRLLGTSKKNEEATLDAIPEEVSNSSSDEDEDFVEVCSESEGVAEDKTEGAKLAEQIEICFKAEEEIEDDIFSDIFTQTDKTLDEEIKSNSTNISEVSITNEISQCDLDSEIEMSNDCHVTSEVMKRTNDQNISDVSNQNENSILNKSQEKMSKSVVREMIKEMNMSEATSSGSQITSEQLKQIERTLEKDQRDLMKEKGKKERLARNITDQMQQETQELLRLFGIPYVIAPMEAESQCAFLNEINLTDGTITEDSDIWLFGGKIVYKNFFNQSKHILEYRSENIEHHFKLTREQLILLALLVGSDYTVGISGVGPVTALEILAAFPPIKSNLASYQDVLKGLSNFKTWYNNGKVAGPGKAALRNKLKNIEFTEAFPNISVIQAYLEPKIETSKENFTWGKPDFPGLTEYARQKFGWSIKKSEEILKPIINRMKEKSTQTRIENYFRTKQKHKIDPDYTLSMSKRVKKAVKQIGNEKPESDEDVQVLKATKKVSRRKVKEIHQEVANELKETGVVKKVQIDFFRKDVTPQKLKTQASLLKNKMKAIEVFRKSKLGNVKKRVKSVRKTKEDAELSESDSD